MSCCGNKRAAYAQQQSANNTRQTTNNAASAATGANRITPPKMWPDLHFECIDNMALTVIGPVTGKHYRWTGKGDIQVVDYRDAGGLRPHLHSLKRLK